MWYWDGMDFLKLRNNLLRLFCRLSLLYHLSLCFGIIMPLVHVCVLCVVCMCVSHYLHLLNMYMYMCSTRRSVIPP